MKPLLRDIVRMVIEEQPDIQVVGEIGEDDRVADVVRERRPDLVIWGVGNGFDDRCSTVLRAYPDAQILAVDEKGRTGTLYRLRPHKRSLGKLSKKRLVNAIRTAASE